MKKAIFFYPFLLLILISSALYISFSDYFQSPLSEQATMIQPMSDEEFDAFVVAYISNAQNAAESISTIQNNLEELGVEFISENKELSPYSSASAVGFSSYVVKRSDDPFYRIYGQIVFYTKEGQPAKEDILAIGWNTNQASYYSYREGDYANAREYDTSKGIFSFNIDDTKMIANRVAYGAVYVIPNANATELDTETSFVHTYNTATLQWNGSLHVGYGHDASGGFSISVTAATVSESTSFCATNTIYL